MSNEPHVLCYANAPACWHVKPEDMPAAPAVSSLNLKPIVRVLADDERIKQTLVHSGYACSSAAGWASSLIQAILSGPTAKTWTPEDLARYACDVSQAAIVEFEKRGWAGPMPSPEEVIGKDVRAGGFFSHDLQGGPQ